jgi:hypothetical protein
MYNFLTYLDSKLLLLQFILSITVILWYEGVFKSLWNLRKRDLILFRPILDPVIKFLQTCNYLAQTAKSYLIKLNNWRLNDFNTSYTELKYRSLSHQTSTLKFNPLRSTFSSIVVLGLLKTHETLIDSILVVLGAPKIFLKRAFLPIYVTWILVSFIYKVIVGADLNYVPRASTSLWSKVLIPFRVLSKIHERNSVSKEQRVSSWKYLTERFTDNFIFLNQYYKLNDLIWQDGFLIDFLQKKVVDRWVRTFVIYSGYLFNERFVFDKVVRFYIDFIIWPGYKFSIYESTSIANTLTLTLFLLIILVLLLGLHYLQFILLI